MSFWKKTSLLGILLVFSALTPLAAVEIDAGDVRLVLHDGIGRFSLYTRSPSMEYVPLFVDQDPRTSGMSIVVNEKIYKLGDSAEFSETVERAEGESMGGFRWRSRILEVVQEFAPVSASESAAAEGVRMTIRIRNRSSNQLSVGLRICLDTYLGEDNLSHFSSDRHQEIRNELTVSGSQMIRYWVSSSAESPGGVGLVCITDGPGVTPPDKIVFANWKRLSDASWDYKTSSSRNFNLMPYSINDSAVCMYYNPVDLPASGSREIVLILGNIPVQNYTGQRKAPGAEAALSAEPEPSTEAPPVAEMDRLLELRDRLNAEPASAGLQLDDLNNFIELIDQRLGSEEGISDEDLRLMEQILSVIKEKSER
jgi:hypothetical protein